MAVMDRRCDDLTHLTPHMQAVQHTCISLSLMPHPPGAVASSSCITLTLPHNSPASHAFCSQLTPCLTSHTTTHWVSDVGEMASVVRRLLRLRPPCRGGCGAPSSSERLSTLDADWPGGGLTASAERMRSM